MGDFTTMLFVVLAALVFFVWQDNMRARETAFATCLKLCEQQGVRLLDQSIYLRHIYPGWNKKIVLKRSYRFDFTLDDGERYIGYVQQSAYQVSYIEFDMPTGRIISYP